MNIVFIVFLWNLLCARQLIKQAILEQVAAEYSAYALDGTPYAFYHPENFTAGFKNWVIYLEGGGECEDYSDCLERSRTELGSSDSLDPVIDSGVVDDMLSSNSDVNPTPFAEFGILYLPYLSGDDWLGLEKEALDPWRGNAKKKLWFCGANNFLATILIWMQLLEVDPENVLITGGSAGGQGAFFHADRLAYLLNGIATVKANPQYGWFEPQTDTYPDWIKGKKTDPSLPYPSSASPFDVPSWMVENITLALPKNCVRTLPKKTNPMRCTSLPVVAASVNVPLFVSTNLFDEWTTDVMEQVPDGKLGPSIEDDPKLQYLLNVTAPAIGGSVQKWLDMEIKADRGAFVPACFEHPMEWADSPKIQGCTHAEAVTSWFLQNDNCNRNLIDSRRSVNDLASLACNAGRFRSKMSKQIRWANLLRSSTPLLKL